MILPFNIIVAIDQDHGIGKNGVLPWHLSEDLKYFKQTTCSLEDSAKKNAIIMGRKTWESIPEKYRPLPDRINIVLTKKEAINVPKGVLVANSFEDSFSILLNNASKREIEKIFVIGGGQIFEETINLPECHKIHVTHILNSFECDTFFPQIPSKFVSRKTSSHFCDNNVEFYFSEYTVVGQ